MLKNIILQLFDGESHQVVKITVPYRAGANRFYLLAEVGDTAQFAQCAGLDPDLI
jgi:hypothetical protein